MCEGEAYNEFLVPNSGREAAKEGNPVIIWIMPLLSYDMLQYGCLVAKNLGKPTASKR